MKEKILKGRNMKRLLSVVLALAMVFTLMPLNSMTVYADSTPHTHSSTEIGGEVTFNTAISSASELQTLLNNGGSGYLTADIEINTNTDSYLSDNVSLCLNGYSIITNARIAHIAGHTMNIYDCADISGTVKNKEGISDYLFNFDSNEGSEKSGILNIYGGTYEDKPFKIEGTSDNTYGKCNIYNGCIKKPNYSGSIQVYSYGQIDIKSLTIQGTGTSDSRGIYLSENATANIKNVSISNVGQAIKLANYAQCIIENISISNCKDAIRIYSNSKLYLYGGLIKENQHGLYIDSADAKVYLGGDIKIYDNIYNSIDLNVYVLDELMNENFNSFISIATGEHAPKDGMLVYIGGNGILATDVDDYTEYIKGDGSKFLFYDEVNRRLYFDTIAITQQPTVSNNYMAKANVPSTYQWGIKNLSTDNLSKNLINLEVGNICSTDEWYKSSDDELTWVFNTDEEIRTGTRISFECDKELCVPESYSQLGSLSKTGNNYTYEIGDTYAGIFVMPLSSSNEESFELSNIKIQYEVIDLISADWAKSATLNTGMMIEPGSYVCKATSVEKSTMYAISDAITFTAEDIANFNSTMPISEINITSAPSKYIVDGSSYKLVTSNGTDATKEDVVIESNPNYAVSKIAVDDFRENVCGFVLLKANEGYSFQTGFTTTDNYYSVSQKETSPGVYSDCALEDDEALDYCKELFGEENVDAGDVVLYWEISEYQTITPTPTPTPTPTEAPTPAPSQTAKTIHFDLRGGAFTAEYILADVSAEVGDKLTKPVFPTGVKLKKADLSLQGWFKDEACTEEWDFAKDKVTEDMTLYAGYAYDAGNKPVEAEMSVSAVEDVIYTGKAIKPSVIVKHDGKLLTLGQDYTVTYKNNINANPRNEDGSLVTGGIDAKYKANLPTIIVKGKGNYKDVVTLNFNIKPRSISENNVTTADITDAIVIKPKSVSTIKCTLKYNNKKIRVNKDYTAVLKKLDDNGNVIADNNYPNLKVPKGESGKYRLTVTGMGNFSESYSRDVILTESSTVLSLSKASVKFNKVSYDGKAISANELKEKIKYVKVGKTIVNADDYEVVLADDLAASGITSAGRYAVTIKAKSAANPAELKCAGSRLVLVTVTGMPISKAKVSFNGIPEYNGKSFGTNGMKLTIKPAGSTEEKTLVEGIDYTITKITNAGKAGKATVVVTGKGSYTGSKKFTYKINKKNIADEDLIVAAIADQNYQKSGAMPDVVITLSGNTLPLKKGVDYTLSYKNNKKAGSASLTIKGKGNFTGKRADIPFTIVAASFVDSNVTVDAKDVVYNARKATKYQTKVTLYDGNGKKLSAGKDYSRDIKYYEYLGEFDGSLSSNAIKAHKGQAISENAAPAAGTRIIVEVSSSATGSYTGEIYGCYRIVPASIAKANIKISPQMYTGDPVTVSANDISKAVVKGTKLTYGTDYEIVEGSYTKNVKVGTASVKIRGIGNYGGTKVVKFKITKKKMQWWKN